MCKKIISPPLSNLELDDIDASEKEFSSNKVEIYKTPNDLIHALHSYRRRFQNE